MNDKNSICFVKIDFDALHSTATRAQQSKSTEITDPEHTTAGLIIILAIFYSPSRVSH
jgi:hypothetical protein